MVLIIVGCLAVSALTLLFPSTPTYDPWAWILWGREIAHLDLVTEGGPSWKPLPDLLHGAVLALRPGPGAVPVAVGRARGRAARLRDGLPDGVPAGRRRLVRRGRRACPRSPRSCRATSSCATPRSATPSRCSPRSSCGRSSATSTAAATTRSTSASPPRCCGPRRGRSSACTGSGCGSPSRELRKRLVVLRRAGAGLLVPARVVGVARPVPRGLARERAEPGQRRVRRAPGVGAVQPLRARHDRARSSSGR